MESNYGSSESNYGFSSGRSYGGFSSESSFSSESRDSYRPSPSSSESRGSRVSSESRGTSYEDWLRTDPWIARGGLSSASEMHQAYQEWVKEQSGSRPVRKTVTASVTSEPKKYNSLDDIDKLIEKLENSMNGTSVTSERANQVLAQRKQKIAELKKLVADARKAEEEERMVRQLEQENSQLDNAIDSLNKGFHR